MKIVIIGGTGLLGSECAQELVRRGHEVIAVGLEPTPADAMLPKKAKIVYGNYIAMSDGDLKKLFQGADGFVFAAGVDERIEGPSPIYEMFKKYNITPLERLLRIAKENGVKHAAICGSYFSYFAKIWPEKELTKWHPYIRSRIDQENVAFSFVDKDFNVAILELPYIFGTQSGRKPVWVFLVEMILGMKGATYFPPGGTTMVTVRQVGQALAGALERNRGATCYPIGYYNLSWKEMLALFHKHMGMPEKKVVTIPKFLYGLAVGSMVKKQRTSGHEGGLNMVKFADVMCTDTFIDKSLGCEPLGVLPDDIDAAIGDSVKLCMEVIKGRTEVVDMKGE